MLQISAGLTICGLYSVLMSGNDHWVTMQKMAATYYWNRIINDNNGLPCNGCGHKYYKSEWLMEEYMILIGGLIVGMEGMMSRREGSVDCNDGAEDRMILGITVFLMWQVTDV